MKTLLLAACCAVLALGAGEPHGAAAGRERSATIAVTPDGGLVVVANHDSASVTVIDAQTRAVRAEVELGGPPQTLTVTDARAYVARRDGWVSVVDLEAMRVVRAAEVGGELFGIVRSGERLFVSDLAAVHVLDVETLARVATIATEEQPRGMALDAAARRIYATHFRSGRVSVLDADALTVMRVISTGPDSNLSASVVLAGNRAYVPQTRSNVTNEALLFDTTLFPIVSALDLAAGEHVSRERISLDIADRPVNMPFDAVVTSDNVLWVVHAGSDDVSVIDLATRRARAHVAAGSHPRGIALSPDERLAFVNNALSGTVSMIDTSMHAVVDTIRVTTIPIAPHILNGKVLFHTSARAPIANDRWISCASCHFDGGADARTWFFRDGPRNTPALFGVAATLPMHWSGDLDELHDVESTIRIVQAGTGLAAGDAHCTPSCDAGLPNRGRSQDLDDLALFMATLQGPRRIVAVNDAARRGQQHFAAACTTCHPAPLYTDRRKHDVGTGGSALERKGSAFDTPSLRGVYDTAPYLHDGSAATLRDAVTRHTTTALTSPELEDLVEFLNTLSFPRIKRRAKS